MMQAKGWWKRWMAAGALMTAPLLAWAQSADPHRWQLNMGRGVTASSQNAYEAHMIVLIVCVVIGVIVFGAMGYAMFKFRRSKGAVAAQFSHNTTAEVIWTVIPVLILIAMAYILFTLIVPIKKQPVWIANAFTLPLIQDTSDVLLSLVPDRDTHPMAAAETPVESRPHKARVHRSDMPQPHVKPGAKQAAKSHAKHSKKSYGASERQGLDNLIQSTSGSSPPASAR